MKYSYTVVKNTFHAQEPWINVFIIKHITIPIVYLMVNFTKITPNIISLLSAMFGMFSAYSYVHGNIILAGIMYFVSYIFDATDGKVARLTGSGKNYGFWLDIFIDRINLIFISTAIAYNSFLQTDEFKILILNSIFLGISFIGWESRYNINYYKISNKIINKAQKNHSKYKLWCLNKGVVYSPISMPELFLFYFIVAPIFKIEVISIITIIILLVLRVISQQKFWISVHQDK